MKVLIEVCYRYAKLLLNWDESNPLWPNPMWLKDPEDLHQNQLQDHQNHPQDHQNRLQGLQNLTNKQPPLGGGSLYVGF